MNGQEQKHHPSSPGVVTETKELIERLRNGDAMNGRTVNCKLDQCNCAIMEDASSLLASQAEEIERLKALAICGPLGHPQGCGVCERCKAETQLAYADAKISRLTRERDEALEAAAKLRDIIHRRLACDGTDGVWNAKLHYGLTQEMQAARSALQSSSDSGQGEQ